MIEGGEVQDVDSFRASVSQRLVDLEATINSRGGSDQIVADEVRKLRQAVAAWVPPRASSEGNSDRWQSILESVVSNAPHYIQVLDTELCYTYVNRIAPNVNLVDFLGKPYGRTFNRDERKRIYALLRHTLKSGEITEYKVMSTYDGAKHWYKTTAGPIREFGEITGVILITFDITTEKLAQQVLEQEKVAAESARLRDRALLNSIGEGLLVIDEAGRIANINPSGAAMLGYRRKELIGKWFNAAVEALDERGLLIDPLERPVMRALTSGKSVAEHAWYVRKDGTRFPVSLTISPVVHNGKPIGAIEVFRDTTEERELDNAKEEFVSLASHQLRTPATGVKAFVSMMLDGYGGSLSDEQQEFLQKVYDSNERQLQVVNDMLNVARVDAGRIVPEMTSTVVNPIIYDVVEEQKATIRQRRQELAIELPNSPIEAVLDGKLLRMVMENLLSNASKYTPVGGNIRVRMEALKGMLQITVSDTGVGIAKSDVSKLFQRFSRIPNQFSAARGGTGLGLYLANNIVRLHDGEMAVDSEVGKGTEFTVTIPLKPRPRQVRAVHRAKETPGGKK